jgi:hypothetical protein
VADNAVKDFSGARIREEPPSILNLIQIIFELRMAVNLGLISACSRNQAAIQIDTPPWCFDTADERDRMAFVF